jgi:regulator of replication initiation timing
MVEKPLSGCRIVTLGRWSADYTTESLKKWIEHQHGQHQAKIDEMTTHLVVTEDKYMENHKSVQEARELIKSGSRVDIVKFEWLEAVFNGTGRRSVSKYLWEDSNKKTSPTKATRKKSELLEAVEDHVALAVKDENLKKAVQKRIESSEAAEAAERAAKADWHEHTERIKHAENPHIPEVFGRGAKKAKDDYLSCKSSHRSFSNSGKLTSCKPTTTFTRTAPGFPTM